MRTTIIDSLLRAARATKMEPSARKSTSVYVCVASMRMCRIYKVGYIRSILSTKCEFVCNVFYYMYILHYMHIVHVHVDVIFTSSPLFCHHVLNQV